MNMAGVIGVGGVFFKSADSAMLRAWYKRVLDFDVAEQGGAFFAASEVAATPGTGTVFSPFAADTSYFAPSKHDFMINLLVDDLDGVLARAAAEGVVPEKPVEDYSYGRFAHIMDPEGRKLELWQPVSAPE
jgi:predicted enzyme related to lactoylglutathione lyase